MTIEKLDATTPDLTARNVARITELFPECVTEGPRGTASDAGGPVIDFDLLRQALSDHLVEGPQERYRLDWPGKRQALLTANAPINKTLRPMREDSVDFDTTRNLFIEGDNLDALKLLQETYLGKVKMIYIDPPYNTGTDFIYKDDFSQDRDEYDAASGQRDEEGGRLVANLETNGRFHSDWLSMMYPRLKLARDLLRDDGAIFVSIDFNEVHNLRAVMDSIFGADNFQRQIIWRIGWLSGYKTMANNYIRNHDVILFYTRNATLFEFNKLYINNSDYKALIKNDKATADFLSSLGLSKRDQASLIKFVNHDNRPDRYPIEDTWNSNEYDDLNSIAIVSFTSEKVSKILGISYDFKGQKSVNMLRRIILSSAGPDDLIMDFFGGTASTAHAVLAQNVIDGGSRTYITVQLPESIDQAEEVGEDIDYASIAALAKARLRAVGKRIMTAPSSRRGSLDIGFRAFRIDSGNFHNTSITPAEATQGALAGMMAHIKDDRSDEDLLFGALLRWGVDITLPVARRELLGRTIWVVGPPSDGEQGAALIACFARPQNDLGGIDTALADALAALAPLRVLFRDDGFAGDAAKENVASRLRQRSPDTAVRVL